MKPPFCVYFIVTFITKCVYFNEVNPNVPNRYKAKNGENLGHWCFNIRSWYKKGKMEQERIDKLNEIGFQWDTFSAYWEEGYKHAKEYFENHSNLLVQKRYVAEDGYKLGLWLYTQRAVRAGRVSGNLTEEKIKN